MIKQSTTSEICTKRTKQISSALLRAQVAAAKKALQFGQPLYTVQKGCVVSIDPRRVLKMAGVSV